MVQWLIEWPRRVAHHLTWLAPLFARITVGWVFMLSGWGKLHALPPVFTGPRPPSSATFRLSPKIRWRPPRCAIGRFAATINNVGE